MYKALIFDLDGTLLDTITDITEAINEALKECGYQYSYDRESTKTLIGDGSDTLVRRALREKSGDVDAFSKLNRVYMPLYLAYQNRHTKPFIGIVETLEELKKAGISLFIVSNKPDHLVKDLIPRYFPIDLFKECHGNKPGEAVKPNPHQVNRIIEKYGLDRHKVLYVGDSRPDVEVSINAQVDCALCKWGYGDYLDPICLKAKFALEEPGELLSIAL